jgi:superfamily II DNA or RNA helicase
MQQIGLYEQIITQVLAAGLNRQRFFVGERPLNAAEAQARLARFLSRVFAFALDAVHTSEPEARVQEQIQLANRLILWLQAHIAQDEGFFSDNLLDTQGRVLTALYSLDNPIAADLSQYAASITPLTGLSESELFTGSNAGISLEAELKREILSADRIDWLVSFVKWAGIRIFRHELEQFARSGRQLRIITTSYMGATDAKAVEFLASLPNTQVKLSYNTQRERLHAKSYLFHRDTGFHTGYIGSSNLSYSALTSGLEWNLKITAQEIPHIIEKTAHTFETYWASAEFEHFDGQKPSQEKLKMALREARGERAEDGASYYFDIAPYPHQQDILEKLQVQRQLHSRHRNLVVAATGTGKTLISAFDFAQFLLGQPQAKFLFVAHRAEILRQARAAYRGVLKNSAFGALWADGEQAEHYGQLFASIQNLNKQLPQLRLASDFYDYIVIDEVHHIAAESYRALLLHFQPQVLLGLTATPERHDGGDILQDFDGVIAAEIRLPEAINRLLLTPFQYFAIDDETDLRSIPWARGRYDIAQLSQLYTHNEQRVRRILQSMQEIITDIGRMKALAFCVSREHALYMSQQFLLRGIAADVLTSDNSQERQQKQQALRSGACQILCVVDIFNEGVDIPEVDTLLFLRPTESLTIFLQQLGRGLRLAARKEACTVLDFVGNSRPEYDFSGKFRALIGKSEQSLETEIRQGFPHAPLGCRIELSKRAEDEVLRNIRAAILTKLRLLSLIRQYPQQTDLPLTLENFLKLHPHLSLPELYKRGSWTALLQEAQSRVQEPQGNEDLHSIYLRAIATRLLGCDAHDYLQFLLQLVQRNFTLAPGQDETFALMCHYDFWQAPGAGLGFVNLQASLHALRHPPLQDELKSALRLLLAQIDHLQTPMPGSANVSLLLHARYSREQILVGFGATSFAQQPSSREGVYRLSQANVELLFVTLDKSAGHFSPSTQYHDYAINETLFHWQSQNASRPDRGRGREYIEHQAIGKRIFLFVREANKDEYGRTLGFVNFGEVDYLSHSGSQPMSITWRLQQAMPSFMWQRAAKLAVG